MPFPPDAPDLSKNDIMQLYSSAIRFQHSAYINKRGTKDCMGQYAELDYEIRLLRF